MNACIRENATGEVRECSLGSIGPFSRFWWTEGNASCDCNRHDWFYDLDAADDAAFPCGDTAYGVLWVLDDDGLKHFINAAHPAEPGKEKE